METEPADARAVRDSIALLVAERGVEGAERELQRRFREGENTDRTLAGLAVLRREYQR
jgi:hypothetical protein